MTVQFFQGDCLDVLPHIPLESIDCVITDPPYGINLTDMHFGRNAEDRRLSIAGDQNQEIGNWVVQWSRSHKLPIAVFARPELPWQGSDWQYLVWDKGGAVGGGGCVETTWKRTWELIQVAEVRKRFGSRDSAVLRFTIIPSHYQNHPSEKPVDLIRYLIRQLVPEGGTVLDPFAGSGTTGIAAMYEGRNAILIEKEANYAEIILKRIAAEKARMPLFPTFLS